MATPNSYGLTSLTFGTPTVTGYVVQAVATSQKTGVVAEIMDESGVRVHARYDDLTTEVTFDAIIQGATIPEAGSTFTVDGSTYEVISVDVKRSNKEFKAISIKGKKSEGITYA